MATATRASVDVEAVSDLLRRTYQTSHPEAQIDVYRYNSACIRVCVIDPAFAGRELDERWGDVWPLFKQLPPAVASQISVLLTIPPEERDEWPIDRDFDTRRTERG